MLDTDKTKADFHALPATKKYEQLVQIFASIKDKNENCSYIYEKLITKPELFDDTVMESIYSEVMTVYARITGENKAEQKELLLKQRVTLHDMIYHKEAIERTHDEQDCDTLLDF